MSGTLHVHYSHRGKKNLAELWEKFKAMQEENRKWQEENNVFRSGQHQQIPVEKINLYHELQNDLPR